MPMHQPRINYIHSLFPGLYRHCYQPFHEDFSRFFSDQQLFLFRIQKINKLLLVNLKKTNLNLPISKCFLPMFCLQTIENMLEWVNNYPRALIIYLTQDSHGVSLACTCLPIHKECSIVTTQNMIDKWQCSMLKDIFLRWLLIKNSAKLKLSWFFCLLQINHNSLGQSTDFVLLYLDTAHIFMFCFITILRLFWSQNLFKCWVCLISKCQSIFILSDLMGKSRSDPYINLHSLLCSNTVIYILRRGIAGYPSVVHTWLWFVYLDLIGLHL